MSFSFSNFEVLKVCPFMTLGISSISIVMFPFLFLIFLVWIFPPLSFRKGKKILRTIFIVTHKFEYVMCSFILLWKVFNFCLDPSSFSIELSSFHKFISFLFFCYWWYSVLTHGVQVGCRVLFQFYCICWDLLFVRLCGHIWRKFHKMLRRKYIVLCWGEMFCKYLSIWFIKLVSSGIFLFCLFVRVGFLSVPLSYMGRQHLRVVFLYELAGPCVGAKMLRIAISSWWIFPLVMSLFIYSDYFWFEVYLVRH